MDTPAFPQDVHRPLLPLPLWTLLALAAALVLVTSSRILLSLSIKGVSEPLPPILAGETLRWGLWLPVVPLAILLDRRWGFGARPVSVALSVHAAAAIVILAAQTLVLTSIGQAAGWYFALETARSTALIRLVHDGATGLLVYGTIVGADHLKRHLDERARARVAEANLEARLARERLRNLQTQLHPHFLFNALHAVGGLIREGDRDTAIETVSDLGELLRRALRESERQLVTLEEELDFVNAYLKIQKARHGERLRISVDAPPSLRSALVPNLLLQPLIENAVMHAGPGLARHACIRISAARREDRLVLAVVDNGPGYSGESVSEGVGLRNTRERLAELYGDDFVFRMDRGDDGGTAVQIEIPFCAALAESRRG